MSQSSSRYVKLSLWWDAVLIGQQIIETELADISKWRTVTVRLDPELWDGPVPLHESTYLRLGFELVDSKGRRLTTGKKAKR